MKNNPRGQSHTTGAPRIVWHIPQKENLMFNVAHQKASDGFLVYGLAEFSKCEG